MSSRQQQLRNARWMQVDYCCTCSVVLVYSRVCSQPSAFTSSRDTTSWLALISRHAPCHKHLFLVQKFHLRRIPRDYRENHRNSCEKAGILANSISTRETWREGKKKWYRTLWLQCLSRGLCVRFLTHKTHGKRRMKETCKRDVFACVCECVCVCVCVCKCVCAHKTYEIRHIKDTYSRDIFALAVAEVRTKGEMWLIHATCALKHETLKAHQKCLKAHQKCLKAQPWNMY